MFISKTIQPPFRGVLPAHLHLLKCNHSYKLGMYLRFCVLAYGLKERRKEREGGREREKEREKGKKRDFFACFATSFSFTSVGSSCMS